MRKVAEHTHFFPVAWKGRCHTFGVMHEFAQLYRYKLMLLLDEIAGTLLCPLVLFRYSRRSQDFLDFVRNHSRQTGTLGTICTFGAFDLMQGAGGGSLSALGEGADSKMASSMLTFSQSYPSFYSDSS